ncbi:MAG: OmpA family protein [Gammaproteobacteria bacterium]|jgi:outer membrane protein OmpA-like peptidoglycan-associated protein
MRIINRRIFLAGLIVTLSACKSTPELSDNKRLAQSLAAIGLETSETERGLIIHFPDINFEYASSELKPEALDILHLVADRLNNDYVSDRQIAVEGHTDSRGSDEYNMNLSKNRAEAVADALTFRKIASERIEVAWFGESSPIAPNDNADGSDNPEGRAKNRRVEIIVVNP